MSKRARPAAPERLRFIDFQMPTLVEQPPKGDEWIHEIKYDGYRTQLIIQDGDVRAYTRNGHDWTRKYAPIVAAAAELPVKSAILDGEVIVAGKSDRPDFHSLSTTIRWMPERLVFVAFDLLHCDGAALRMEPLIRRRALLENLVGGHTGAIQFSSHVQGNGAAFYKRVDEMGLEGMVSKRADSLYLGGARRSRSWLKTKCFEEEFEVAGVKQERGKPPQALLVSRDDERRYVGSAFIALNQAMRERLWARVKANAKATKVTEPGTIWLKPGLIGRVRHLRGEDKLRHATLSEIEVPRHKSYTDPNQ